MTVDAISVTYDALGYEVEITNGSSHTQILYTPLGKSALMNGQTRKTFWVPLVASARAVYDSAMGFHHQHPDWLGSARVGSTSSKTKLFDRAFAPFSESYANSGSSNGLNFTGQTQDSVGGTYDFLARQYNPNQGRWVVPDPAGLDVTDPMSPQSWNRYTYVQNSPLNTIDPDGMDCIYVDPDSGAYQGFQRGDCDNSTEALSNSGQYVDGTVNTIYTSDGTYNGVVTGYSGTTDDGNFITGRFANPNQDQSSANLPIYGINGWGQDYAVMQHDLFNKFPNICSLTFSLNAGAPSGRMRVGAEYNTQKGFNTRGRAQGGIGPFRGRVTMNSSGKISTSVRVGGAVGVTMGLSGTNISSVGVSANITPWLSGGVSGQVAQFYSCKSGNTGTGTH